MDTMGTTDTMGPFHFSLHRMAMVSMVSVVPIVFTGDYTGAGKFKA
jgi:hypothetical protein